MRVKMNMNTLLNRLYLILRGRIMLIQNSEKSSTVSEENDDVSIDDFFKILRMAKEFNEEIDKKKKEKEDK